MEYQRLKNKVEVRSVGVWLYSSSLLPRTCPLKKEDFETIKLDPSFGGRLKGNIK